MIEDLGRQRGDGARVPVQDGGQLVGPGEDVLAQGLGSILGLDLRRRLALGSHGLGHADPPLPSSQRIPSRGAHSHVGSTVAAYSNS